MKLGDLGVRDLSKRLPRNGVKVCTGPFTVHIRADGPVAVYEQIHCLHADYPLASDEAIADFHVSVRRPRGLRRWVQPQVRFYNDHKAPFQPLPAYMAFPILEWGINLCIADQANQYLLLHSGVVERNGVAIVFPAHPGSGKTTLCAALMQSGWRLLSDEFGLVQPLTSTLVPLPRPLPLKNASIDVIRGFAPDSVIGPIFPKTKKGDVAHLKPASDSVERASETALARLIVFPLWKSGSRFELTAISKSQAFLELATNSFNYEALGDTGFRTVDHLVSSCDAYRLVYSNLSEVITELSRLADQYRTQVA